MKSTVAHKCHIKTKCSHRIQITHSKLKITHSKLEIHHSKLQIVHIKYKSLTANTNTVSVKRGLRTADCGPGVKCRLRVQCRLQTKRKMQARG